MFGQNPCYNPCVAGDAFIDAEFENSLTNMVFTSESMARTLPSAVDNSTNGYMPPIFNQYYSFSCVHCAEIGYVLTYELNRYRGVDAGSNWTGTESQRENLYHPFFTYNFVNRGDGRNGTGFGSGFRIVSENGCPTLNDYYDPVLNEQFDPGDTDASQWAFRRWMDGEEKYINASENKTWDSLNYLGCYQITWGNTYETLDTLKRWLCNHNSSGDIGGLAVISVNMGSDINGHPLFSWETIQTGPETDQIILTSWAPGGLHALTIVGYNDDICVSGNYTAPGPNTPLSECEKGAFKAANSWGNNYTTSNGYVWIPYSLMDNIYNKRAYTCVFKEEPEKTFFLSATVKHPKRDEMTIFLGKGENASSPVPTYGPNIDCFEIFNRTISGGGGPYPINGNSINSQPIGLSLNFREKFDPADCGKYFFQIKDYNSQGYSSSQAFIENYYLTDFRWDEEFVMNCENYHEPIQNGTVTTLAINYHLLPFEEPITSNYFLSTDRVARRTVTVDNGTFTINNGVKLDMYGTDDYDCNLVLNTGTNLVIGDNAVITAKRGNCLIDISGEVQVGNNVRFVADYGATLLVRVNHGRILHLNNCMFENASLLAEATKSISAAAVSSYIPEISVINCDFIADSGIKEFAIKIDGYTNVTIMDDTINGLEDVNTRHYNDGIIIQNSGNLANNSRVMRNVISGCTGYGLTLLAGRVNVLRNHITACAKGVCLLNNSTINRFKGNCAALSAEQTQYIHDNDITEVFVARGSVPQEFRFNHITNSNNAYFVQYDGNYDRGTQTILDLEYNNWGINEGLDARFNAVNMGTSSVVFDYMPKWNWGVCLDNYAESIAMEQMGDSLWSNGFYTSAKLSYKEILELFPTSISADNAMKKLFLIECFSGQDFTSLQNYYRTNSTIQNNDDLKKLASYLSNKCDEEMKNYDAAIAWYENIISDTTSSVNDSIFATIDLGFLYLVMQNEGNKAMGKMKEFIPKSVEAYSKQTNYALHQLRFDEKNESQENNERLLEGKNCLVGICPNPANDIVRVTGKQLERIEIINVMGQRIISHYVGGEDSIYIDLGNVPSGIYFISVMDKVGNSCVKRLIKR